MSVGPSGVLTIYALNVGQADTSVIVTPEGSIIIIDATRPDKLCDLLGKLGLHPGGVIEQLIVTHPHVDHFSAVGRLLREYRVVSVTLAPFWNKYGMGPPSYRAIIGRMEDDDINVSFLSGYSRLYPDGAVTVADRSGPNVDPDALYLELLGPSNSLINVLESGGVLDTNHLSVMTRLTWRSFRMVIAADAQMENWGNFDQEGMLDQKCHVLRTAHHGSCNGTQWERLSRLDSECVIVSSDPNRSHHLPDLIGTAIFAKYSLRSASDDIGKIVALTSATGTVRITVPANGQFEIHCFGDRPSGRVPISNLRRLTWTDNPTDWERMLLDYARNLYV